MDEKENDIFLEKTGMTKTQFLLILGGIKEFIKETFDINFSLIFFDGIKQELFSLYSDSEINMQLSIFKHIIQRFGTCLNCELKEGCEAFKMQNMNMKKTCDG